MLVAGAKGHAKDIVSALYELQLTDGLIFFDNFSMEEPRLLLDKFPIIESMEEAICEFKRDSRFLLGVGNPLVRHKLSMEFSGIGGQLTSVVSPNAVVGVYEVKLGRGVDILAGSIITNDVCIGEGTLINVKSSVHHDCRIGKFCEIGPGTCITGGSILGDFTSVGANSTILPKVKIGSNVTIGSGAVVTADVPDNSVVVGIPGKVIKQLEPLNFE